MLFVVFSPIYREDLNVALGIQTPKLRFGMTGPQKHTEKNTKPHQVFAWIFRVDLYFSHMC